LITAIILGELREDRFNFATFYARRVKRIFPALIIVILSTLVAGWVIFLADEYRKLGDQIAAGAGFLANILFWRESGYFDISAERKPLLHLWSLGVEEQFYVLWPLTLFAAYRLRWNLLIVAGTLGISSFLLNINSVTLAPEAAFYLPQDRFWELMVGAAVAIATHVTTAPIAGTAVRGGNTLSIVGLSLLALAVALIDENRNFPGWWGLLPTLGAAAILTAGPNAWINRNLLSQRVAVRLGLVSYPLYLWHWPILSFQSRFFDSAKPWKLVKYKIAAVSLSVALAWLTHVVIETKANRLFIGHGRAVVAFASLGMAVVGFLGLLHFPPQDQNSSFVQLAKLDAFVAQNSTAQEWRRKTCFLFSEDADSASASFARNRCDGGEAPRRPLLLLAGDSTAAHLYPGLEAVYGRKSTIAQFTSAFCVPLIKNMDILGNKAATGKCREANNFVFDRAASLRPDVVVVSADFSIYESVPGFAYPAFDQEFLHNMQDLQRRSGAPVVVVGQLPIWINGLSLDVGERIKKGVMIPDKTGEGLNRDVFEIDNRLKNLPSGEGVTYVSMIDRLCDNGECRIRTGEKEEVPGDLIAFDRIHLSTNGSRYVVTTFIAPIIGRVAGASREK
jgi:peptidoglycan/LPS O-acetylase OafA/YrhL